MYTKIIRYGSTPQGTFGKLQLWNDVDVIFECFTVEKIWLNNKAFKSCVPSGAYTLKGHLSTRWGNTYAIVGGTVSQYEREDYDRYACVFHTANRAEDVVGCIGLGDRLGVVYKAWAVMNSANTVKKYLALLHSIDEVHTLEIQWATVA